MDFLTKDMHNLLNLGIHPFPMIKLLKAYQHYLTPRRDSQPWGIEASDLGYTKIPPGSPYPPGEHPESYTLNQREGRVLDEYQIIYITRGKGRFWSTRSGHIAIKVGIVFLLFPGVRHRYHPDPETGWDEQWIGFSGEYATRIMDAMFSPEDPVHAIGHHPEMQLLFTECCELAQHGAYGFRDRIAVKILEILVQLSLQTKRETSATSQYESTISKACQQMLDSIESPFDTDEFVRANGLSHSSFRRHFKLQTGMAPIDYLLDLRLQKARRLLMHTTLPVKVIAEACGFDNPLYFSRYFKKRTGVPPTLARKPGEA